MRYDQVTFLDLFNIGCPKLIAPIENLEDFKLINTRHATDLVNASREHIIREFKLA